MKHLSARRLAAGLAVTAIAAATVTLTGVSAQAAPGDFNDPLPSSFTPGTGTNLTVPTVTVPQGCPAGSATVVGQLFGGSLPIDGQLMYGPVNNPLTTSFTYQPQSFQDTFADAGISVIPAGAYSLKTQCQDTFGNDVRVYSSLVNFTSATAYDQGTTTATTLTVTPPSGASLAVTLNAAVAPAAAGSVQFFDNGASVGTDASAPFTFTTGANTQGAVHTYKAVFTPSGVGVTGSTSPDVVYTIPGFSGVQASYNLTTTVAGGALTLTIANPNVSLGAMVFNAGTGKLESFGTLTPATLIDLRAGNPGWNVSGQTTDFTSGATDKINGANLGWTPGVLTSDPGQTVVAGPVVVGAGGVGAADPSVAGLKTSRVLASAAAGVGRGTATLNASLGLSAPTSTAPGSYGATLTLTAI